jgi:hypothetical protein
MVMRELASGPRLACPRSFPALLRHHAMSPALPGRDHENLNKAKSLLFIDQSLCDESAS